MVVSKKRSELFHLIVARSESEPVIHESITMSERVKQKESSKYGERAKCEERVKNPERIIRCESLKVYE